MSTNVIQLPSRLPQWTFADRIRKVRRDARLTIDQMAEELNVGVKAYGAWEAGRNTPGNIADIAVRLERVTGVPRTWFLGWESEDPRPDGPDGGLDVHPLGLEPRTHWIRDYQGVDGEVVHVDFGKRELTEAA